VLAAALYAIPMISGLLDNTMEVKSSRPDPQGNRLNFRVTNGGEAESVVIL
jgi:hypothetical protein